MKNTQTGIILAHLALWLVMGSCKQQPAYTVYYNGDIITMETDTPQYVEAVVAHNGKIVFVGALSEAEQQYSQLEKVDLNGQTMLPGFIDPHSHFSSVSNAIGQLNVSPPPIGNVTNIPQLLENLKRYKEEQHIQDGEWIFATGYDDNELVEHRHPTSEEIDKVLPANPVYIDHVSGHMGVANSMALQKMKVDATTQNPPGGNIGRYAGTNQPNGLVQETAMYPFVGNMLQLLGNKFPDYVDSTQNLYAANGYTTAQDGLIDRNKIKVYQELAQQGKLKMDIIGLAGFAELKENLQDSSMQFKTYRNRFKVQGTKLIADGSPQGKTAFFSQPYLTAVPGCMANCKGLPSLDQETLNNYFMTAYKSNNQLFVHCNGDASIDMVIAAHIHACKLLNQPLDKDRRTVIIHAQFIRLDQLETFVKYKFLPSFFTNHAFFWGDVHVQNLGKQRAEFLSPLATADSLGLLYTNHSDATVTPLHPMLGIWSATNRTSRSGKVIGQRQIVNPYRALKAITIHAAYEYYDEQERGSLVVGKLADFVVLDKNPLKVNVRKLRSIQVTETIKEGKTIFKAN